MDIYKELKEANINLDCHESDLYAIVCDISSAIIAKYPFKSNITRFRSEIDGKIWFDIPFAYAPFWEKKNLVNV